jgi:NAD(P)H-dependent FMN reductase
MSKPVLQVIICSTRPGRVGPAIATWFFDFAKKNDQFDVELVDLATFDLPIFDEPRHPSLQNYEHEHTKRWSASVKRANAFVFVMPEYNHSYNAATKNAIDYLNAEWKYKPIGLLGYGGVSMGMRAIQQLKPTLALLKLIHAADITVSLIATPVVDGVFSGSDILEVSATQMLDELKKLVEPFQPLQLH